MQSIEHHISPETPDQEGADACDPGGAGAFRHMHSVISGEWGGVDVGRAAASARSVRVLDRLPA